MSDTTAGGPPHDHATPAESAALAEFRQFRERMNTRILGENNLVINRFFNLDGRAPLCAGLVRRPRDAFS